MVESHPFPLQSLKVPGHTAVQFLSLKHSILTKYLKVNPDTCYNSSKKYSFVSWIHLGPTFTPFIKDYWYLSSRWVPLHIISDRSTITHLVIYIYIYIYIYIVFILLLFSVEVKGHPNRIPSSLYGAYLEPVGWVSCSFIFYNKLFLI